MFFAFNLDKPMQVGVPYRVNIVLSYSLLLFRTELIPDTWGQRHIFKVLNYDTGQYLLLILLCSTK